MWVLKALWRLNPNGNPELIPNEQLMLWWYPPQTTLNPHKAPKPDLYFAKALLCWMPYKMWQLKLHCTSCDGILTGAGVYRKIRTGSCASVLCQCHLSLVNPDVYHFRVKKPTQILLVNNYLGPLSAVSKPPRKMGVCRTLETKCRGGVYC